MKIKIRQKMRMTAAALAVAAMVSLNAMPAFAATAKISFSDPSAMVGGEVNVTMKVSSTDDAALDNVDIMLAYDANALEFISGTNAEGGAGSIKVKGSATEANTKQLSFTLKFKALSAGKPQITVSTQEIYDGESQPFTLSKQGNSTVNIVPPATFSQDANLSSLKISPGSLSPAFSPDVTAYTATVGGDAERIAVDAGAASANAKVVTSGNETLNLGENVITCKVTAEDGQTVKEYTIAVTKVEGTVEAGSGDAAAQMGEMKVTVDGVEYSIAAAFDPAALPVGFDSTTYTYKDAKVAAGRPAEGNQILLYLADASGKGGFYFYDETSDSFTPCVKVDTASKSFTILPLEDGVTIPEGFAESRIEIEGQQVRGWVWSSDAEQKYCVFYGMNDRGEKGFFRYDLSDKTMQRYFQDPSVDTGVSKEQYVAVADLYNSLRTDYGRVKLALIGCGMLCLILLIAVITLLARKPKRGKHTDDFKEDHDGEKPAFVQKPERTQPAVKHSFRDKKEESYLSDEDFDEELLDEDYSDAYEEDEDLDDQQDEDISQEEDYDYDEDYDDSIEDQNDEDNFLDNSDDSYDTYDDEPYDEEPEEDEDDDDFEFLDTEEDSIDELEEKLAVRPAPRPVKQPESPKPFPKVKARELDDNDDDDFEFMDLN